MAAYLAGPARLTVVLAIDSVGRYATHHCGTYAAAIAYYTLFSLVPLTLVVVSVVGLVVDQNRVVDFVFDLVPLEESEDVRRDVADAVDDARAASPGVLLVSAAVLLWSASGVFGAVRRGLNATTERPGHSYIHGKALDLTLVPISGLAILTGLGLLTAVQVALQQTADLGLIDLRMPFFRLLGQAIVAAVTFAAFMFLYRFVPYHRPDWPQAIRSAICAAALFETAKVATAYALASTPFLSSSELYTGIGTALTLLFWVFVASSILLYGAEFGQAVTRRTRPEPESALGDGSFEATSPAAG
ncbi:MAG TPA: YihY/virulence factor BrkB family protein [Dehalococcoidia bacterium]|jgi:membrane protein|nr:YihY/virulence factor BrkB family protein [Dehalococcoidia bacterium]